MAAPYRFFKPRTLTIHPSTMDRDSAIEFSLDEARAALQRSFPSIQRMPDGEWRTGTVAGWPEFRHAAPRRPRHA